MKKLSLKNLFATEVVGEIIYKEYSHGNIPFSMPVTLYMLKQDNGKLYHGALYDHLPKPDTGDKIKARLAKNGFIALWTIVKTEQKTDGFLGQDFEFIEWKKIKDYKVLEEKIKLEALKWKLR